MLARPCSQYDCILHRLIGTEISEPTCSPQLPLQRWLTVSLTFKRCPGKQDVVQTASKQTLHYWVSRVWKGCSHWHSLKTKMRFLGISVCWFCLLSETGQTNKQTKKAYIGNSKNRKSDSWNIVKGTLVTVHLFEKKKANNFAFAEQAL